MEHDELHPDLYGWWRITETSQWVNEGLDDLGPALLSITGHADRLRMHCLLAYVNFRATKTGASFTWEGAWEYDPMKGTGSVRLGKDGRLRGRIQIENGDDSSFIHTSGERNGKRLDSDCCIVFEVKNGQMVSGREHFYDLHNWDAFWA